MVVASKLEGPVAGGLLGCRAVLVKRPLLSSQAPEVGRR